MSKDEEYKLERMLQKHIDDSEKYRSESQRTLSAIESRFAKLEVHHDYTTNKLKDHEDCITDIKDSHSKQKGAIWAIGAVGGVGFFGWLKSVLGI
jgi:chromosome segregation ATPase